MTRIVIQAGHCHRKTGVVGTRSADGFTEQQFTWPVANRAARLLHTDGHDLAVILADEPSDRYRGDAFVAVHADGNNSPSVGGASVGYRTEQGKALAHAWKAAYRALGWTSGFRSDNYTDALSGYYGTKRAVAQGNRRACIIEAGFLTNPTEAAQLSSEAGQDRCAQAIRRAVNAVLGIATPTTPTPAPTPQEDDMADYLAQIDAIYQARWNRGLNPDETIHYVKMLRTKPEGPQFVVNDVARQLKHPLVYT